MATHDVDDVERRIKDALAAMAGADTREALDRAYVDHVPSLVDYIDDQTLASMTRAYTIRAMGLRNSEGGK